MKTNSANLLETTKTQKELKERVLTTITEYAEEFEKALIEIFFIASIANNGTEIDKEKIDHLHLLYKVLQDAKEISQPCTANILINELINS